MSSKDNETSGAFGGQSTGAGDGEKRADNVLAGGLQSKSSEQSNNVPEGGLQTISSDTMDKEQTDRTDGSLINNGENNNNIQSREGDYSSGGTRPKIYNTAPFVDNPMQKSLEFDEFRMQKFLEFERFCRQRPNEQDYFDRQRPNNYHDFNGQRPNNYHDFNGQRPNTLYEPNGQRPNTLYEPIGQRPNNYQDFQGQQQHVHENYPKQRQDINNGGQNYRQPPDTDNYRQRSYEFYDVPRYRYYDSYDKKGRNTVPVPLLHEYSDFNTWVTCVRAWSSATELAKDQQGYLLASELPKESEKYGKTLKDDFFKNCPATDLINNEAGIERVIDFLKTRVFVDEEKELFETKRQMTNIKRRKNQNINQFLIDFENINQKAKQLDINIKNDKLLALTLFECANLDSTEETVIRGVCDFTAKDGKRYETVKQKLREVCSKLNENNERNNEEVNLTQNSNGEDDISNRIDEVYISRGWKPPTHYQRYQNSSYKNPRDQNKKTWNKNSGNNIKTGNFSQLRTKKRNPLGPDGKPMRCKLCDATTHFMADCPDAFENTKRNENKGNRHGKYEKVYLTRTNEQGIEEEKELLIERSDGESGEESVHCTVLCSDNKEELNNFTAEAINMAALDTCCTASVTGEKWLNVYLQTLPEDLKQKVQGPIESKRTFIFGNQGRLKSKAKYTIPVKIGGEYNEISFDVISSDIPLLLSKAEMKRLGITLDMKNDKGYINGKPLVLHTTSAGHYIVDLLQENEALEEVNVTELETNDEKEQIKRLDKIHKQFGHRPKKVLVSIIKDAGKWNEKFDNMIDKIMEKCEGCLLRKRVPDKPAVAAPLSSDFGQVLTIDLKVWNFHKGIYILYMIDHFTRFQVATVVRNKEPETIIKAITTKWLPIFGKVDKILSDNGTEFSNENMREVASALNVQLLTTGAHSPWQNGLNERNHHITDNIVRSNLRDYPNMPLEVALAWAITAINSLSNVRGFSPYQLVFGRQIKLPNILDDPPPAWEEPEKSKTLLETLEALHAARKSFIESERSERLRKALKAKIRIADTIYENGDIVYFHKEGEDKWRGPAKVVFQDSKVIFIRLGASYYRVSANRLLKAGPELAKQIKANEIIETNNPENEGNELPSVDNRATYQEDSTDTKSRQAQIDDVLNEHEQWIQQRVNQIDNNTLHNRNKEQTEDSTQVEQPEEIPTTTAEPIVEKPDETPAATTESIDTHEDHNAEAQQRMDRAGQGNDKKESENTTNARKDSFGKGKKRKKVNQRPIPAFNEDGTIQNASQVLKRKDRIEILEDGKWEKGSILSHGGKVGGRNAGWFNIELDNGHVFHDEVSNRQIRYEEEDVQEEDEVLFIIKLDSGKKLEVEKINDRKIRLEDEEEAVFMTLPEEILAVLIPKEQSNTPEVMQAKFDELNKLKAFDTYEEVEDVGQERITTVWVLTEKGDQKRARLTARGFQETGEFPTDSPTVQKGSVRLILALAATNSWTLKTIDISSAFLQGDEMDRDVFVKPPKEANALDKIWRLKRCLYGLKDASRKWYFKVLNKLKEKGFQKSCMDKGLFFLIKDGVLIGVVGIHVDDFLQAGTPEFERVMEEVVASFKVGKLEAGEFMYTGYHMKQAADGITFHQNKYVKDAKIPQIDVKSLKDRQRDMTQDELTQLRQITGMINWAARATRPDIAFDALELSTKFKGGKVEDLIRAQSVASKMKKNEVAVKISNLRNWDDCQIWVFTDAAFRNLNQKVDSCGGYVIFLVNIHTGHSAVMEWRTNKLKRKVHSTLGAETQILYNGIDAALGYKTQIKEMTKGVIDLKVRAITDNMSAKMAVYSESDVSERMLRADIAIIKDMIDDGRVLEVCWVAGKEMLADILTKRGVIKIPILEALESGQLSSSTLKAVLN